MKNEMTYKITRKYYNELMEILKTHEAILIYLNDVSNFSKLITSLIIEG
jgi:hypothetical protein